MKKKQSKKKTQFKKKKNYPEKTAFANLEKASNNVNTPKRSSTGIPKYVADRMARRIFCLFLLKRLISLIKKEIISHLKIY